MSRSHALKSVHGQFMACEKLKTKTVWKQFQYIILRFQYRKNLAIIRSTRQMKKKIYKNLTLLLINCFFSSSSSLFSAFFIMHHHHPSSHSSMLLSKNLIIISNHLPMYNYKKNNCAKKNTFQNELKNTLEK